MKPTQYPNSVPNFNTDTGTAYFIDRAGCDCPSCESLRLDHERQQEALTRYKAEHEEGQD